MRPLSQAVAFYLLAASAYAPATLRSQGSMIRTSALFRMPPIENVSRLRRVILKLEKDTADDGRVTWKIIFDLFERDKKTDDFGKALVEISADLDAQLNSKAQAMATNGITTSQFAYAIGPAADTAKAPEETSNDKLVRVQSILKK
jgi:hypothetical protein